ncbi:hypothetical protein ACS0TY_016699 [Phlomoides rotata]
MLILSLNARGTNSSRKRKSIKELIKDTKADFVCLQETKREVVTVSFCEELWPGKEFKWIYSGSNGASGGLLILWKKQVFLMEQLWGTEGALAMKGKWTDGDVLINLVNIYAPNETKAQLDLWKEVQGWITSNPQDLWCVCGDFNMILYQSERRGRGRFVRHTGVKQLRNFIENSELVDLPLLKRKYTWYKDNGESCSRIDRFLISASWYNRWPNSKQTGLKRTLSDHARILLENSQKEYWGPVPFKIVNWWMDKEDFRILVNDFWKNTVMEGWHGYILKEKMKYLKVQIKEWSKNNGTTFSKEITEAEKVLEQLDVKLETVGWDIVDRQNRRATQAALEDYQLKRDRVAIQKCRSRWLKEGDANTNFFHSLVKRHAKLADIRCVRVNERWLEGVNQVKEGIFLYFKNFFTASKAISVNIRGIDCKILDQEENKLLIEEFSVEEIKKVVWSCEDNKSPGPDGYNFKFIKGFWNLLEEEVVRFCSEFHCNGNLAKGINSTFIVLIPKVRNPLSIKEFRPISLVGCLYKIIAKLLAARLASVLKTHIALNQSAFVKDRHIVDSIVVANEVIDEARKLKKSMFVFKIDFEKAYDSIRFSFLFDILERMGFDSRWIGWIRECVSTAYSSIIINGSPTKEFHMEKGLRQGDPLSPFLFLIVANCLNLMMKGAVDKEQFSPCIVGSKKVEVSILQYADDTIFFGEAKTKNIKTIKCILRIFEVWTGLKVNFHKSDIMGINVKKERVKEWCSILNCKQSSIPFKYLGLHVGEKMKNSSSWEFVTKKLEDRLHCWENTNLSLGGRIVLINSVLTNLPSYAFSFCRLPKNTTYNLTKIQRRFLWGEGAGKENRIAWVKWDNVCREKKEGGLGIKNVECFNLAYFGKWGGKIMRDKESLVSLILDSKYGDFRDCCERFKDLEKPDPAWSFWWFSLVKFVGSSNWFFDNFSRKIGNGKCTRFWFDKWIGGTSPKDMFPRLYYIDKDPSCSVADRFSSSDNCWNFKGEWRRNLYSWEVEQLEELLVAAKRYLRSPMEEDYWCWKLTKDGQYSVRSAYQVLLNKNSEVNQQRKELGVVWNKLVPSKIAAFAWKLLQDRIPTMGNLLRRGSLNPNFSKKCRLCGNMDEETTHLFFGCHTAKNVWNKVLLWLDLDSLSSVSCKDHLEEFVFRFNGSNKGIGNLIWQSTIWNLWLRRNATIFSGKDMSDEEVFDKIRSNTFAWLKNRNRISFGSSFTD